MIVKQWCMKTWLACTSISSSDTCFGTSSFTLSQHDSKILWWTAHAMQRLGSFPAACSRSGADTPCLPTSLESELIWTELWRQQLEWFFELFTSFIYIYMYNLLPTLTFVSLTMSQYADRPWSAYSLCFPLCHDVISLISLSFSTLYIHYNDIHIIIWHIYSI